LSDVTRVVQSSESDKHSLSTRRIPEGFRWTGVLLLLACALIHLISAPDHLQEATYVGVLFLANGAGALLAAYGIYRDRLWGWLLGALGFGFDPLARTDQSLAIRFREGSQRWAREAG
jgi:hypothetical protein